ncbi:MAG: hypothetical protein QM640_00255 [Niabella sp.]
MILILTSKGYEQGTTPVINWLIYKKAMFFILNYEDIFTKKVSYKIDIENQDILINNISVKDNVKVIWYRRFYLSKSLFKNKGDKLLEQLHREALSELETLLNYLKSFFKNKLQVPRESLIGENKLIYLNLAKQAGISCPSTIVTNNKKDLLNFYLGCEKKMISKPIYFSKYFCIEDITYTVQTTQYDDQMISKIPDYFFPTLFQQAIDSIFEIRVFYLDKHFFSTAAIYSSHDGNIDLKLNYRAKHLHWVPYELPKAIRQKLIYFMDLNDLTTGSIDLLRTDNDFIFLEVNPVGQYLAPSEFSNYYVDYEISKYLIQNSYAEK